MNANQPIHVRGVLLPSEQTRDLWVSEGVFHDGPIAGAETVSVNGWILPGLVDAHCHVGIRYGGGHEDSDGARRQAVLEAKTGVLLARDAGAPVPTRFLDNERGMPRIIRAGRHIAAPKRYIRDLGIDLDNEADLPAEVRRQARAGDGWVKIVADWIDRDAGDLTPLWSDGVLKEAITAAHDEGARVTAHVFGEDALPGLLEAGIDCIEHGTGLTADTIDCMARNQVALVPTLINIENFPGIAENATRFPRYAQHMRDLHARGDATVRSAIEAGVPVYTGTDAGGMIKHGRVVDEIVSLLRVGMTPADALGAGSWEAREWLGVPQRYAPGDRADFTVYSEDPRRNLDTLRAPARVVCDGRVIA
ncbi:amidohydrolase family protein [Hoyosella sp. YIM 151337]|uniref:amidohydrolase family protein n=1 Tax=Hoyosella sp. YIM 151337 TaxID=2992742 RepID=UPI002236A2A6|nr:amidohydrolase family protein [Hoyosella sp. YIM 151337]MCW4353952.1 amidohydrolase family protein [Hoyosella sp. YIM 151337]